MIKMDKINDYLDHVQYVANLADDRKLRHSYNRFTRVPTLKNFEYIIEQMKKNNQKNNKYYWFQHVSV